MFTKSLDKTPELFFSRDIDIPSDVPCEAFSDIYEVRMRRHADMLNIFIMYYLLIRVPRSPDVPIRETSGTDGTI